VLVPDRLGEAARVGEPAPRQLGVAGRAVEEVVQDEHGEDEQGRCTQGVVVELVGEAQRLGRVPAALVVTVRPDPDDRQRGQQPAADIG